jgi:hypothetical protein
LARLNPGTIRYDIGRGGVAELTNIDIAGALGFVSNKFGREILCHCWWPAGAELTAAQLDEALAEKVRQEMDRLQRARQIAALDLHIAQENLAAKRAPTGRDRMDVLQCQRALDEAKEWEWPTGPAVYVRIRRAVLGELCKPGHCQLCAGRGTVMVEQTVSDCPGCTGSGTTPASARSRAREIGVDHSRYLRMWYKPYEWTLALAADASNEAAAQLKRALARGP